MKVIISISTKKSAIPQLTHTVHEVYLWSFLHTEPHAIQNFELRSWIVSSLSKSWICDGTKLWQNAKFIWSIWSSTDQSWTVKGNIFEWSFWKSLSQVDLLWKGKTFTSCCRARPYTAEYIFAGRWVDIVGSGTDSKYRPSILRKMASIFFIKHRCCCFKSFADIISIIFDTAQMLVCFFIAWRNY